MPDPFMQAVIQSLQDNAAATLAESRARDVAFAQQLTARAARPGKATGMGGKPNYFAPESIDVMPNANPGAYASAFPAERMGDRLRQGQNPVGPGYRPDSLPEMARDLGMAPTTAYNQNFDDQMAAADKQFAAGQKQSPYLNVTPADVVQEADLGKSARPADAPERLPLAKPATPPGMTPEQVIANARVHALVQKHGIGPLLGAMAGGKSYGQAAETLGQLLKVEQQAQLGDFAGGDIQRL